MTLSLLTIFSIGSLMISVTSVQGYNMDIETKLRADLLNNYSALVRPSNLTRIEVAYHMTALLTLNVQSQQFSVAGRWSLHWNDTRLTWDDGQYPDIPALHIRDDKIWTPDLVVDKSVCDAGAIDKGKIPLRVDSDGSISWSPPGLHTVSCDMEVTYFPFDTQVCSLHILSLGNDIQEVDLDVPSIGFRKENFINDGEWELESIQIAKTNYTEGGYEYAKVIVFFRFIRKGGNYGFTIIFPVFLTALLVSFVFYIPAESGEKIAYCLTLFLAYMVSLTIIAEHLPTKGTDTSYLDTVMGLVLVFSGSSVAVSIFSMRVYHSPDDIPIPESIQKMVNWYIQVKSQGRVDWRLKPDNHEPSADPGNGVSNNQHNVTIADRQLKRRSTMLKLRPVSPQSSPEDVSRGGEITWKTVSIVFDEILFPIYLSAMVLMSLVFFPLLLLN